MSDSGSKHRVLVVEDDLGQRQMCCRVLETLGIDVHEAVTGEEAVVLLAQESFHLVLIDLSLPGTTRGEDLVAHIRRKVSKTLPMVILTGIGSIESCKALLKAGVDDYLTKPCDVDTLRHVVERLLRLASHREPASSVSSEAPRASMTRREGDVLHLLRQGLEDKEIAAELKVSVRTVNAYVEHLFVKFHCGNRTELVALSYREDLLSHHS